ncbi:MAG: hypothetical protein LBQ19_06225, partial [Synergistaceae bacterium]|nr:hypothetical protein [Synergistaceae bacterium]
MLLIKVINARGNFLWRLLAGSAAVFVFLSAAGAAFAAEPEIGGVPVTIGEPEMERRPISEMDLSGVAPRDDEPFAEDRPVRQRSDDRRPRLQSPPILSLRVEGNSEVVSDHILSVVTSQVGSPIDQNRLSRDADAIYEQGFYSNVDYRLEDEADGAHVVFIVTENPIIEDINFFGNTMYSVDQL